MPRAQLPLAIAFPRARDFSSFRVGDNAAAVAAVAAFAQRPEGVVLCSGPAAPAKPIFSSRPARPTQRRGRKPICCTGILGGGSDRGTAELCRCFAFGPRWAGGPRRASCARGSRLRLVQCRARPWRGRVGRKPRAPRGAERPTARLAFAFACRTAVSASAASGRGTARPLSRADSRGRVAHRGCRARIPFPALSAGSQAPDGLLGKARAGKPRPPASRDHRPHPRAARVRVLRAVAAAPIRRSSRAARARPPGVSGCRRRARSPRKARP